MSLGQIDKKSRVEGDLGVVSLIEKFKLTEMEKAYLAAMIDSEYGEDGDGTYETAVRPSSIPQASRPGVIGSLVKKGIIVSEDDNTDERTLWFTELGREVQAHFVELTQRYLTL